MFGALAPVSEVSLVITEVPIGLIVFQEIFDGQLFLPMGIVQEGVVRVPDIGSGTQESPSYVPVEQPTFIEAGAKEVPL